jgi:hypothetical protein
MWNGYEATMSSALRRAVIKNTPSINTFILLITYKIIMGDYQRQWGEELRFVSRLCLHRQEQNDKLLLLSVATEY